MNKPALRKLYLEKRKGLAPEEIAAKTNAVIKNFSGLNFTAVEYLHIFYPIVEKGEFDTLQLADFIRSAHPHIHLVLSKSDFNTNSLSHFVWDNDTDLKVNKYGITEPAGGLSVSPEDLDMVLIPLLAFDRKGNRIGYGRGFYDRFLAGCRSDVKKTGISLFPPVEFISDINEFDIPLNNCITPEKIWQFDGTK